MRSWRGLLFGFSLLMLAGCAHSWCCHPWWQKLSGQCCSSSGPVEGLPVSQGHVIGSDAGPIFAAPPGAEVLKAPPGPPFIPDAPNLEAPPSKKELAPPPRPGPGLHGQPSLAKPIPIRTAAIPKLWRHVFNVPDRTR